MTTNIVIVRVRRDFISFVDFICGQSFVGLRSSGQGGVEHTDKVFAVGPTDEHSRTPYSPSLIFTLRMTD
ncbi:hypothetical protein MLPF_1970 [Mycobacterium lepromatosis]|nr:hypothetical protein MLPF_1970 [Mycobacterium lepromatosis]